ncbi:ABC transporter ATP-binding protein [Kribbella sp. NPDC050124]|uniref:ABC transporter ATP-binding protein n=1 Tax=Kribbella sp. NPDC050124 TaxID=3364114 RepID=UPI0037881F9A
MTTLQLSRVSVTYRRGRRTNPAVQDVSFSVSEGETVALVGESGSGKSSLGRVMAGLQRPTAGTVRWEETQASSTDRVMRRTPRVQMVFQHPDHSLNPTWTVRRSVAEPLVRLGGVRRYELRSRVAEALQEVGLGDEFLDRHPKALSGGQAQRVAVARAIISRPQVVVLDEPTASLDQTVRTRLLATLMETQTTTGAGYLLVSHDMSSVRRMSDRILVMYRGRIVEQGNAAQVLEAPLHPYTRALIAAVPPPDPRTTWAPEEFSIGAERELTCQIAGSCAEHGQDLVEVDEGHWVRCSWLLTGTTG